VELDEALDQSGAWSDFIDVGLALRSYVQHFDPDRILLNALILQLSLS